MQLVILTYVEEVEVVLVQMVNDKRTLAGNSLTHHPTVWKRFAKMSAVLMADAATFGTSYCIVFRDNFPAVP